MKKFTPRKTCQSKTSDKKFNKIKALNDRIKQLEKYIRILELENKTLTKILLDNLKQ